MVWSALLIGIELFLSFISHHFVQTVQLYLWFQYYFFWEQGHCFWFLTYCGHQEYPDAFPQDTSIPLWSPSWPKFPVMVPTSRPFHIQGNICSDLPRSPNDRPKTNYTRVGKSNSVKLRGEINRKPFTWLLYNSASTHARITPWCLPPVTQSGFSGEGRKCFLIVWVWRCKMSLLPLFSLLLSPPPPRIGTCWGVIRAGLNWTAKSWLQWEEKQEMF